MFDHANRIHERLIDVIGRNLTSGWAIQAVEKDVALGEVTGRYDTRLWHDGEGWEIIVDWKTMRGRAFGYTTEAKLSHVVQVEGYVTAADADAGLVFYVDREGQNAARQFYVARNDARAWQAARFALEVAGGADPGILEPQLTIRENKGPNSVYLKQPWMCDYCDYADVSCPGALPKKFRELGIVGKVGDEFMPTKGIPQAAVEIVEELLNKDKIPF